MKTLLIALTLIFSLQSQAALHEALLDAVETGNIALIQKYKKTGGDLNDTGTHGMTLLMQAAASGQKKIVTYLLKEKVKLDAKNESNETALAMALGNDQDQIAVDLIQAGAAIDGLNDEKNNMVYTATSSNSVKSLKLLTKKAPTQVNAQNPQGDTALHEAARYGTPEVITLLLQAGAKKDLKNKDGKTPADLAKAQNNKAALKLLAK